MADDLEKYLNDLGIDTDGEDAAPPAPPELPSEPSEGRPSTPHPDTAQSGAASDTTRPDTPRPDTAPATTPHTLTPPVVGDHLERCEAFLASLLLTLDPGFVPDVREVEDELHVDIRGGDPGKIIGRNGRTLAALEYLTNAVVNKDEAAPHVRVSVDVGGYKERRDERLRAVALKAAARARKTGFAVELETMSAAERRVIHMALADDPAVESESSGEGKNRRVVVKPRQG